MTIETTPEQTDSIAAPETTDTTPARKPFDPCPPLTRAIQKVLAPLGRDAGRAIKTVALQAARELIDGGWDLEAPFPFNLSDHVEFEAALTRARGRRSSRSSACIWRRSATTRAPLRLRVSWRSSHSSAQATHRPGRLSPESAPGLRRQETCP